MSSSTHRADKIPSTGVYEAWPQARDYIQMALDCNIATGDVKIEDIYLRLVAGGADLWIIRTSGFPVAAFITQVAVYERTRVLLVPYIGGRGAAFWIHLLEDVKAEARAKNCQKVELLARRGWKKLFEDQPGFKEHWTMFRIDADEYEDF